METILQELAALRNDVAGRGPTVREKTAAAAFLAQFYGGVENILKRISSFHAVDLPVGNTWHIELFKRFCSPAYQTLPELFDGPLSLLIGTFRKFRHVVYHGYGFQLDWDRMREGIETVDEVYMKFRIKLNEYLEKM
jgi:hypothetical protein